MPLINMKEKATLFGIFAPCAALLFFVEPLQAGSAGKAPAEKPYEQAKKQLPEPLYPYYRLLDRIMGANPSVTQRASIAIRSIDANSCRQMLGESSICSIASQLPDVSKDDHFAMWALQTAGAASGSLNASAESRNNQIIINKALDDNLSNDLEAKACVVAHEIAHIQQDHTKAMFKARDEWNTEAADRISSAIQNAKKAKASKNFWNTLAIAASAANAGYQQGMGNYYSAANAQRESERLVANQQADNAAGGMAFNALLDQAKGQAPQVFGALKQMEGLPASLVNRTMKDVNSYLAEVNDRSSALSRQQEIEADTAAVQYLAQAGINPQGCLRVVATLHRGRYSPVASKDSTHPGEQERIQNFKKAIEKTAPDYLKARSQIIKPAPLSFRYDNKLEFVTVYPKGFVLPPQQRSPGADVDALLGK